MNPQAGPRRTGHDRLKPVRHGGNEIRLLEGGHEFFPALKADIDAAHSQVLVETYIYEDDDAGRMIAAALADAARRGVDVRLTVDGYGTPRIGDGAAELLRAGGVRVVTYRPEHHRLSMDRQRLRRLHRKIAVIDGRVAFVGGINVVDDFHDPNHGALDAPRLDFAVRVRGPLVVPVQLAAQRLSWEIALLRRAIGVVRGGESVPLPDMPRRPPVVVPPAGDREAMLVLRDNLRFRRTIERYYLHAIKRARREVLIANAYFFPGARFRRALIHAAARGVRVRLLLQGRIEYRVPHYAAQALYDELLAAGVEIVEYRASFLHAKVAVVDDMATVGSSNIDPFSLLLAHEANVFVFDAEFAADLRGRLERAMAEGGVVVHPSRHARRSWPMRLVNGMAFMLLRLGIALTGVGGRY